MALDVVVIDEIAFDDDVDQAVQQREVGARPDRQVQVGQHSRLGDARVDDDERGAGIGFEPAAENRMVVGDVRADQEDDIGALEIFVGAGRAVAAERALVAGDRRGHAQRGVAVVVARADPELHQLAERVELLGDELAGADDADGVAPVPRLHVAKRPGHRVERVRPAHASESTAVLHHREARPVLRVDGVMLREALGAEHPAVHRMIRIAADADGAAVADADVHAAADRAVAAGRRDPPLGDLLRGHVADLRIRCIGVAFGAGVEAEQSLQRHAASLPSSRYGVAMCFGTTLTKKR